MKVLLSLIAAVLIISGCSGHKTKSKPLDLSVLDAKKVERAENLYRCSSFLNIFTAARQHRNDTAEHTKLTIEKANSASKIASQLLKKSAEGTDVDLNRLTTYFERKGTADAYNMVKEVGASADPNKKNDLFLSCFKMIKKEESLDMITSLSNALQPRSEKPKTLVDSINFDRETKVRILTGHWGWKVESCLESPTVISFSDDGSQLFFSYTKNDKTNKIVEYTVESESPNRLMLSTSTPTGEVKISNWDLLIQSEKKFCWNRSDWDTVKCSQSMDKCK